MTSSSPYTSFFDVWSRTSSHLFSTMLEANRATLAAFGVPDADPVRNGRGDEPDHGNGEGEPVGSVEDRLAPDADLPEWDVELATGDGDHLAVGDRIRFSKTLTDEDVTRFAAASGDTNPIHLDEEWSTETRFNGRIVHGTLASGLISAALARLPGSVIYLSQDVEFRRPVRIGDRVTADVEVVEDLGDDRFRLRTVVESGADGELVIDGEAMVLIDEAPDVEGD